MTVTTLAWCIVFTRQIIPADLDQVGVDPVGESLLLNTLILPCWKRKKLFIK